VRVLTVVTTGSGRYRPYFAPGRIRTPISHLVELPGIEPGRQRLQGASAASATQPRVTSCQWRESSPLFTVQASQPFRKTALASRSRWAYAGPVTR
jgi:hypothetical protein